MTRNIEGTLTGTSEGTRSFSESLRSFDKIAFGQTDFKFIDGLTPDRHFKDLKVLPVNELVFYGVGEHHAPLKSGGVHLEAPE